MIIAAQDAVPNSFPGLIPLQAIVKITFNNGNVTSPFKKPWIQLPQPGNPAFPTGYTPLLLRAPHLPTSAGAWPPHVAAS